MKNLLFMCIWLISWPLTSYSQEILQPSNLWEIKDNGFHSIGNHLLSNFGKKLQFNLETFKNLKVGHPIYIPINSESGFHAKIIKINHYKNKSTSYIAKSQSNNGLDFMVITVGNKQIFSTIVTSEGTYTVRNIDNKIVLINEKHLPQISKDDIEFIKHKRAVPLSEIQVNSLNSINNTSEAISTIGVLVLLTADTHVHFDGDASIQIIHLIAVTNQIYSEINVDIKLEIAGIEEVIYDSSKHSSTILEDMKNKNVPAFENLAIRRYETGGDLVMFVNFTNNEEENICGRAFMPGQDGHLTYARNSVFSYVALGCPDYVFAHEVGHNLGLSHSRLQDSSGTIFPYALGYGVNGDFVTVMAYAREFSPAHKKYLFSSPLLDCNDLPCGIDRNASDGADAVYSLNQIREQAANFFDAEPSLITIQEALENSNNLDFENCVYQNNFPFDYAGQIQKISCDRQSLSGLNAVSLFPHLTDLSVQNSQLQSVDHLMGLVNIFDLNLANNNISDITALSSLIYLKNINLSGNQIVEVNALSYLNNLLILNLSNTLISDLSPLLSLPKLSNLSLKNNPQINFNTLDGFNQLSSLNLIGNVISDISFLTRMETTKLQFLTLSNNEISDISPISNVKNIGVLHLDQNRLTDISPLFDLLGDGFIQLYLNDNHEIYCWQQDYVVSFFEEGQFRPSESCSTIDDYNDFDGDGISNQSELASGSSPLIKTTSVSPTNTSSSGGGGIGLFGLCLMSMYAYFLFNDKINRSK